MRVMVWVLIASVFPAASAHAQKSAAHRTASAPAKRDPLPRFTIAPRGAALAPIGLPLPPIGLPPIEPPRHGKHRYRYPAYSWPGMYFYVPEWEPLSAGPSTAVESQRPEPPVASGRLIMDLEPPDAEVFADGYYVGVLGDFSGARGGGALTAGPHRIDVSARGFESLTRVINVTAGQAVTIRGFLNPLPPPVAIPRTTFYLIPGCYMGNIPPNEARLPATCDQSRATTWVP